MSEWNPDRRYWAMHQTSNGLSLTNLPYLSIADDQKFSRLSVGDPIFVFERGTLVALYQVAETCTWVHVPLADQTGEPASICVYTVQVEQLALPAIRPGDDPVRTLLLRQARHALEGEVLRELASGPELEGMAWPVDGDTGELLLEACQLGG